MNADLHCHSTVSDGLLSPSDLVMRAAANGVDILALTDHDELEGLAEARAAADSAGIRFVDGVEVSVSWDADTTVHIVGLGIDPKHPVLRDGLARVRSGRDSRAGRMADALDRVGIHGAYEGALRYAGNPAMLGRSHFARYIVECGLVRDVKSVFDHWLAKDKPGYVSHDWASLAEALGWIRAAGGIAVVAHPGRYRIGSKTLRRLLGEFKELGGTGIEVVSGSHDADTARQMTQLALSFGLFASRASDFHGPGESWTDVGRMAALPDGLPPVWRELV
jgi:predicted metal-dependent phosphoesterase TrpH